MLHLACGFDLALSPIEDEPVVIFEFEIGTVQAVDDEGSRARVVCPVVHELFVGTDLRDGLNDIPADLSR
jgi:hypothetical protein